MSDEYANSPLTFGMPSGRRTDSPTPSRTVVIVLIASPPPPVRARSPRRRRSAARRPGPRPRRRRSRVSASGRGPSTSAATGSSIPAWSRSSSRHSTTSASLPTSSVPSSSSRPRQRAPCSVPSSSASARVIAAGPPRSRATSSAWRSSPPSSPASLDAAPSTPSPTGAPARTSGTTGAIPAPSRAFDDGQCATPVPRLAEARDLALVEVHAVREPDVVAEPAELLEVLDRPHAEELQAERLLLDGLGHVRVQPHAALAGELGRLGHQLARDAERRARRERDPHIEPGDGSWKRVQRGVVGGEDRVAVLDHGVRRQPAAATRRGPSRRGTGGSGCRARARPRSRPPAGRPPRAGRRSGGRRRSCSPSAAAPRARRAPPRARSARRSAPTSDTARRATRTASPAARARAWPTGRGGGGS